VSAASDTSLYSPGFSFIFPISKVNFAISAVFGCIVALIEAKSNSI